MEMHGGEIVSKGDKVYTKLNNGLLMPASGFGTYQASGTQLVNAIVCALQNGITYIDSADMYGNHAELVQAIQKSGVKRQDIFITTKLNTDQVGRQNTEKACQGFLKELNTDYVDQVLIHWPGSKKKERIESYEVLQKYYKEGVFKSVGVSNYEPRHIEELLSMNLVPQVNQVEVQPYFANTQVREYCKSKNIQVVAYASLGMGGSLLQDKKVLQVAQQTGKSNTQVLLRWGIQSGCVVIPKSMKDYRIKEFAQKELFGFELNSEQMKILNSLDCGRKLDWDPRNLK